MMVGEILGGDWDSVAGHKVGGMIWTARGVGTEKWSCDTHSHTCNSLFENISMLFLEHLVLVLLVQNFMDLEGWGGTLH